MAPSKRKGAPSSRASPPKRTKRESTRATAQQARYTEPSDSEDANNEEPEYKADSILQERRRNKTLQYLVKWDCVDPTTGNIYEPEWVDAKGANELLVASWNEEKAKRKRQRAEGASPTSTTRSTASARGKARARTQPADAEVETQSPTSRLPRIATKPRRAPVVVESSPEPDTPRPSVVSPISSTPAQAAQTCEPATHISPRVEVVPRGGSFEPGEFDAYSQLINTQTQTQESDLNSSQLFAVSKNNLTPGIVPDSQSSAGEASYILPTQATGTQPQSSDSNGEHEEEEDSGLLEIVRETARIPSPVLSIPETVEDTESAEDEQSQRRRAEELESGEGREQPVYASVEEELQENNIEVIPGSVEGPPPTIVQPESQQEVDNTTTQEEIVQAENETVEVDQDVVSKTVVHAESHEDIDHTTAQGHSTTETFQPDEESAPQDQPQEPQQIIPEHLVQPDHIESVPQFAQETTSQGVVTAGSQEDECSTQEETLLESVEGVVSAVQEVASQFVQQGEREDHVLVAESQILPDECSTGIEAGGAQVEQLVGKDKQINTGAPQDAIVDAHGPPPFQPINRDSQSTEQTVTQDLSQFPFYSQFPLHGFRSPQQPTINLPAEKPDIVCERDIVPGVSHQSPAERPSQTRLDDSSGELPQPQHARGQSLSSIQNERDLAAQTVNALQSVPNEVVEHGDLALSSQPPRSTGQSTQSREQNAQIVPTGAYLGTQEGTTESLAQTAEAEDTLARSRSSSRHDSSQETPEHSPKSKSAEINSSPIPPPPGHSLHTFESNVPPRFTTPPPTSSASMMASQDASKSVEKRLKEMMAKKRAEKQFVSPRRSLPRPTASPPSTLASAIHEGTRSPSVVPERAPVPQVQTNLRTVVFAANRDVPAEEVSTTLEATARSERTLTSRPEQTMTVQPAQAATSILEETALVAEFTEKNTTLQETSGIEDEDEIFGNASGHAASLRIPAEIQIDSEELSDADDGESLLNDDLPLGGDEYIVPLFVEGRQSGMYSEHIKLKKDLLEGFLKDPADFEPFAEVVSVLDHLKAIETHVDLVFAEAESTGTYSTTQVEHAAQFGLNNSIKFRFLHTLFHRLRDLHKHVVLVIENNNDALFSIIETFCKAKFIAYNMPTKGKQADPARVEGDLIVTVLSSGESPIIRAADLIICLDGVQQAEQIRQKSWSAAPNNLSGIAPIIHLVIPRTVSHIERYISSALDTRMRVHTILASLAQMRGEVGKAIDDDPPRAASAAMQVADWLNNSVSHWPLPPIGSVKDVIEFQTQMSQASTTESPAPERLKRPLDDDEDLDAAKRMRFTPQPHAIPSSSVGVGIGHEVTHVSDSMPGTAVDEVSRLRVELAQERVARQAELSRMEETYKQERATARKAEEQRFREHEAMWDNQQTVHENQTRDYRALLSTSKSMTTKLESAEKTIDTLRGRLATRTTENQDLTTQLDEQRNTSLLSNDEMIVEMTRVRKDLALMRAERDHALKAAQSTDALHEYTKEQYRLAQDAASTASARVATLEAENAKLARQASTETAHLKQLHLDRRSLDMEQQLKSEKASSANLKRILTQKEDEILRLRIAGAGRMGIGTRASSATPQPTKTRSRAASPLGGRLSSLRNG